MIDVIQIPVLEDNYVYLIRETRSGKVAVVDPAVAEPILLELRKRGWSLDYIFNTHHHGDHVGGNLQLIEATGCEVVGNANDAERIPGISIRVRDGEVFLFGESEAHVLDISGHTVGHIGFHFPESELLFCGDTIFGLGCGRLFEGTGPQMWSSLSRLKRLPGSTKIFCAHEYTLSNSRFAVHVEPGNRSLQKRVQWVKTQREKGLPTIPSLLGDELQTNPFLRADVKEFQEAIGMIGKTPSEVFTSIRLQKDSFK